MNALTITILTILLIATAIDIKTSKIPNILLLSGFLFGFSIILYTQNIAILPQRFLALGLGILILFIPFALGGMGAGDVKLLALIGFFTGIKAILNISLWAFLLGGVFSLFLITLNRIKKYKNLQSVFTSFANTFFTKKLLLQEEGKLGLPFSLPLTIATIFVVIIKWNILL